MSQTTQSLPVNTDEIKGYRTQIDAIDEKIQTLINERAKVAQQVAVAKKNHENHPIFYRPEREAQVLKSVMARNEARYLAKRWHACFVKLCRYALSLKSHKKWLFWDQLGHSPMQQH